MPRGGTKKQKKRNADKGSHGCPMIYDIDIIVLSIYYIREDWVSGETSSYSLKGGYVD